MSQEVVENNCSSDDKHTRREIQDSRALSQPRSYTPDRGLAGHLRSLHLKVLEPPLGGASKVRRSVSSPRHDGERRQFMARETRGWEWAG